MTKLRTANLLGALSSEIAERLSKELKTHPNQNDSSAAALNLIALYEGCSNTELSLALKLSHPATVRLVDKLVRTGLVRSGRGSDRRAVALHLTTAGRERAGDVLRARCSTLEPVVDALSMEQRQQLNDIAETLLRELTSTTVDAAHICRLCDQVVCSPDQCPVHRRAHELNVIAQ